MLHLVTSGCQVVRFSGCVGVMSSLCVVGVCCQVVRLCQRPVKESQDRVRTPQSGHGMEGRDTDIVLTVEVAHLDNLSP